MAGQASISQNQIPTSRSFYSEFDEINRSLSIMSYLNYHGSLISNSVDSFESISKRKAASLQAESRISPSYSNT